MRCSSTSHPTRTSNSSSSTPSEWPEGAAWLRCQRRDSTASSPCQDKALVSWAVTALSAPLALHLARRPLPADVFNLSGDYVLVVESWRLRDLEKLTEAWCAEARRLA